MPGFERAAGWLSSPPLTEADLRGKVVLADFWTYTCINWLRTVSHVRAWADKYRDLGLVVVGVHTPEFPFERDEENVRWAVEDMAVTYPTALDPEYEVWNEFANRYWPAVYIADAEGRIRHHQFGEGGYEECEQVIQRLLSDAGRDGVPDDIVDAPGEGLEAQADWEHLRSPETYLGYGLGANLASPGGAWLNEPRAYSAPEALRLNEWSLSGDWTVESRAVVHNGVEGRIGFRFHARDVHLVLAPRDRDAPVPFRVSIDGRPPGEAHGLDVDAEGKGSIVEPRLYQLVREPGQITDRTFEIEFLAPGAEAYVFTFG